MDFKPNEVKAGFVILASVVVLMVFLVAIFGVSWGEKTKEYYTELKYIGGIQKGSLVKYGGMDVGLVTDITLPPENDIRINVQFKVDERTPVRVDSKAYVTSVGIMADQHIEISPGLPTAELLPSGSHLESKEVLGFAQMSEPLEELNDRLQELLTRVSDIFNDDNRSHLASIVKTVDSLMVNGQSEFIDMMENLEKVTGHLATLSSSIDDLMKNNRGNLEQTLGHLEKTTEETAELIADLRKTLSNVDNMMTTNSASFIEIMENFQYASQNFEEFSRIVKERPWLLIRKSAPPDRKEP